MPSNSKITRRGFVASAAAGLGYLGTAPLASHAHGPDWRNRAGASLLRLGDEEYDARVKLNYNENPYGPSEAVVEAMTEAFRYAARYGYPDRGVNSVIAEHHGVEPENVLLGAGSGEILEVVGLTFLQDRKLVVGSESTYGAVYQHASGIDAEAVTVPLLEDFRQDIPGLIAATRRHYRDVGFVYLCNPNNPTGRTATAAEVRQLLDGIPEDVPVLIDEAYHHYAEDPAYATSVPHAREGRKVIVSRTFSKLYGLAAMRIGYAVTTPEIIRQMQPYSTGSVNALAKYGAVAALGDAEGQERVRRSTIGLRKQTTRELSALGYEVIPSETNFFMVRLGRPVREVVRAFRERGIAVGRPFPPLLEHLRVSVGTEAEMQRFTEAFREIMA
jgi:histidinol-phosphate aminotransferase